MGSQHVQLMAESLVALTVVMVQEKTSAESACRPICAIKEGAIGDT